jgi:transposase
MYIRKNKKKYKNSFYTNYLLVESIHTPKGPRQKTVCSLGDLKPRPRSEWLKLAHKVESALIGQGDLFDKEDDEVQEIVEKVKRRRKKDEQRANRDKKNDEVVAVKVDGVRTEDHREAGSVHVGHHYWKKLGLDEILASIGLSERCQKLTCAMSMNRLICPKSELAMPDWIRRTALADILEVNFDSLKEDSLYRNLDILYPNRAFIESELVKREQTLFNLDHTVYLYDLTSTYFEGQALSNPKAKLGYSRDKRPDCKQVLIGLVINRDGFPIAHEVFEGNLQDRNSLKEMLDVLDIRVGLKKGQTVVVDRGMAYEDNIEQIKSRGLHYLVASRQSERDQYLEEFEDTEGYKEVLRSCSPLNPFQKKSQVKVKNIETEAVSTVLCISSGRREKDRAIRKKQEKRLLADLAKLKKRIAKGRLVKKEKIGEAIGRLKERYPRVVRYYRIEYDAKTKTFVYEMNEEKMRKAEKLDGSYLLKTDRKDLSDEEVWRIYNLLTRAEDAFRAMKSPLMERPIFHQLVRRVETHIFLCILAYHLLVSIEKTLLDKGVHTSWGTVRETLSNHEVCTIVLPTNDGMVLKIRKASTPEPAHKQLYKLLDVPGPIIRPKKRWVV